MTSNAPTDIEDNVPADPTDAYRNALQAIQDSLEQMERSSVATVALTQGKSLQRILRHAHAHTAFYADRLAPLFGGSEEANLSAWQSIPLLTREEIRSRHDELLATSLPPGVTRRFGETSGSSGTPLKFSWSSLTSVSTRAVVERMIAWHGLDPQATVAEIKTFKDAAYPGRRMSRSWSFRGRGASYFRLAATTQIEQQLEWLQSVKPRYLLTYPTLARELAHTAAKLETPISLDAILTVGEVLTDDIREACRAAFGARIIDSYGCQEMGKVAIECEVSGQYHVCASNVLVEVTDDDGRQVAPGEVGKVVLTSLHNYAMPFIRYEIGDYARLGAGYCSCGRSLPLLTEILGRKRNMLVLPDGGRLWLPGRVLAEIAGFVPLKRQRIVQEAPDLLRLLYVPMPGGKPVQLDSLEAHIRKAVHPLMRIVVQPVDALPRSAGGKYEDVVGLTARAG